jgi:hypothetical protein
MVTSTPSTSTPSTRKQLTLLLAVLIGGTGLVSLIAVSATWLIRAEIMRLSRETSPTRSSSPNSSGASSR